MVTDIILVYVKRKQLFYLLFFSAHYKLDARVDRLFSRGVHNRIIGVYEVRSATETAYPFVF